MASYDIKGDFSLRFWGPSDHGERFLSGTRTQIALDLVLILSRGLRKPRERIQKHEQPNDTQEEKKRGAVIIMVEKRWGKFCGFELLRPQDKECGYISHHKDLPV